MMGTVAKIVSGDGVPMDFVILIIFAAGALAGIIAFSKFLHWLLAGYHRPTLLALAGFIIGSLVKVWPWSDMVTVAASQYPEIAEMTAPVWKELSSQYAGMIDYHIAGAVCFALIGFLLVTVIETVSTYISRRKNR